MWRRLDVYVRGLTRPKFDFFTRSMLRAASSYGVRVRSIRYRGGVLTIEYYSPRGVNSPFLPVIFSILSSIGVQALNYSINKTIQQQLQGASVEESIVSLIAALGVVLLIAAFIMMAASRNKG